MFYILYIYKCFYLNMEDSSRHFLCFDGCLLDPETKQRWRAKGSFLKNFRVPLAQTSNQLIWLVRFLRHEGTNSPGRVGLATLGPFHLKAMQNHKPANVECRNQRKNNTKLGERKEKNGARASEKWPWIAPFIISSVDLVLYTMIS